MAKITKKELETSISLYLAIKENIKVLEEELEKQKAIITQACHESLSDTVIVNDHSATLSVTSRNFVDAKTLAADHPKIAAKYTKTTTYEVLRVK